jgi:hypothetical protein
MSALLISQQLLLCGSPLTYAQAGSHINSYREPSMHVEIKVRNIKPPCFQGA